MKSQTWNIVLIACAVVIWGAGLGLTVGLWHTWYGFVAGGAEWLMSGIAWPIMLPALVAYHLVSP